MLAPPAATLPSGALLTVICDNQPGNRGWFGHLRAGRLGGYRLQPAGLAALVTGRRVHLGFVGQWIVLADEPGWGAASPAPSSVAWPASWPGSSSLLLVQLREAQAGLAQRAAAEERNRIAHELHDVIGHALTVSLLHITAARLALDEDPHEAGEALEQAERLAQQSLADVRAVVGLMKDPSAPAPLPGVDDIDGLVESFRGAGTLCRVRRHRRPVPPDGHRGADRLPHPPGGAHQRRPARARVAGHGAAACRGRRDLVQVDSSALPGRPSHDGAGLTGMRERAEALGGRFTAGPSGNGWRVEAVLPA